MRVGVYHPQPQLLPQRGVNPAFCTPSRYTPSMPVILFGMRLLEVMFFIGLAGSAIVVLLTSFEDMHELFSKTKHPQSAEKTPEA
jgi:hypothetical protein